MIFQIYLMFLLKSETSDLPYGPEIALAVQTATGCQLNSQGTGVRFPPGVKYYFTFSAAPDGLGSPPSLQWVPGAISSGE
jgi:hypothetical protein